MRRLTRSILSRLRNLVLAPKYGAVTSVRTSLPLVALTFDDGPNPAVTTRLIDMFARHGAQATHFLVGEAAEAHPNLVHALTDAGHEVANHTYSHKSLVRLSHTERRSELLKGKEALGPRSNHWVRPPYGHYDMECARDVHNLGMRCVMWTGHIADWEQVTAEVLTERLRAAVVPGSIILLHEALYTATPENRQDREGLLEAVDTVLGELAGKVRFGTLTELLKSGKPVLRLITKTGDDEFEEAQRPGTVQEAQRSHDDILAP